MSETLSEVSHLIQLVHPFRATIHAHNSDGDTSIATVWGMYPFGPLCLTCISPHVKFKRDA